MFVFIKWISISVFFISASYGKTVTLYDNDDFDSKKLTELPSGTQLIPFYRNKDNPDWVKVANPKNGEVGWVALTDLQGDTSIPGKKDKQFSQKFTDETDENGIKTFRSFQYRGSKELSEAAVKEIMADFEKQNEKMIKHMQRFSENLLNDMRGFRWDHPLLEEDWGFPWFNNHIIIPENSHGKQQS